MVLHFEAGVYLFMTQVAPITAGLVVERLGSISIGRLDILFTGDEEFFPAVPASRWRCISEVPAASGWVGVFPLGLPL